MYAKAQIGDIVINSSSSFLKWRGQDASASTILFNGLKKLVIES